ncbi:hypothetical protein RGAI101_3139 [Roseobacter sp. GAI101]|nr:hypothetical protein RGAI101_3139 [Roseobacter sp. GAI101]
MGFRNYAARPAGYGRIGGHDGRPVGPGHPHARKMRKTTQLQAFDQ